MDLDFTRGGFRIRGENVDIFPSHYQDRAWRITFCDDEVEKIYEFDYLTGERIKKLDAITIFANSHYVTPRPTLEQAIDLIQDELKEREVIPHYWDHPLVLRATTRKKRTTSTATNSMPTSTNWRKN
jgi:excinuclease ABC subunit B